MRQLLKPEALAGVPSLVPFVIFYFVHATPPYLRLSYFISAMPSPIIAELPECGAPQKRNWPRNKQPTHAVRRMSDPLIQGISPVTGA